jgi:UDP-perosamine 4-acetyltransferase
MKSLIIYGAGYPDIVRLVDAINRAEPTWKIEGFVDDTPAKQGTSFMGCPILGTRADLERLKGPNTYFINNVAASARGRRAVTDVLLEHRCPFATVVHPGVDIAYVEVGVDTVISEGVGAGCNVTIGDHCAVRNNAVVGHDCRIGDGAIICANSVVAGHVRLGVDVFIGAGSIIRQRLEVKKKSVVGAGAVVLRDVEPGERVAGVPAKPLPPKS